MSVYNGEAYLKESIESILNQTFTDFEFIILDDCSTDNSAEIIKSYNDKRIVYVRNEKNLGLAASLNKGIRLAKGEYIARMDDDDISLPERFEKQVKFLDDNLEYGVVGAWIQVFGKIKRINKFYSDTQKNFYIFLISKVMVSHPVVMFRKSIMVDNNIFYDEMFRAAQDYKLWNDLKYVTKITNLQEVLLHYRVHENASTLKKRAEQKDNKFKIIKREFENNFGAEFKESFRNLLEDEVTNVTYKDLKDFLKIVKNYKNKEFKKKIIFRFLNFKVRNKNNKLKKIWAIFYIRSFMIFSILKG